MKNTDDILQRILGIMHQEKKYINEQLTKKTNQVNNKSLVDLVRTTSVFDQAAKYKTEAGNVNFNETFPPIISCLTGDKFIDTNVVVKKTHKQESSQEWYDSQMQLYKKNQANDVLACKYYVTIITEQSKKKIGDFKSSKKIINYDDEIVDCINGMYMKENFKPNGCAIHFDLFSEDKGFQQVLWVSVSWWAKEYEKWTKDNNYTPKSPITMKSHYSIYLSGSKRSYDIENELGKETNTATKLQGSLGEYTTSDTNLPLTKEEMQVLNTNPMKSDNEFKGEGKYICKKSNVNMINLRTSPEVNTDTGVLDPYDNYVNWTSDEIIGKYIGQKRQSIPSIADDSPPQSLENFAKKLTINEIRMWRDYIEKNMKKDGKVGYYRKTILEYFDENKMKNNPEYAKLSGVISVIRAYSLNTNDLSFFPKEIYKKLPKAFKPMLWYNVELMKAMKDKSEYTTDIYKKVWVRSDNVEFCKTGGGDNAQTTYTNENLKRLPMKPLKDM